MSISDTLTVALKLNSCSFVSAVSKSSGIKRVSLLPPSDASVVLLFGVSNVSHLHSQ